MEQMADPIDLWCAKPSARSDHSSNSYLATLLSQYKKEIKLDSDSSTALFLQERQIMCENGFDTPGADEDSVSATMELPAVAYSDFDRTVETKVNNFTIDSEDEDDVPMYIPSFAFKTTEGGNMQRHITEGSAVIENATSESLTKSHADDTTILEEVDVGDTGNGEASSAVNSSSNRSPHHLTELKFPLQSMLIFGGPTSGVRTDADVLLRYYINRQDDDHFGASKSLTSGEDDVIYDEDDLDENEEDLLADVEAISEDVLFPEDILDMPLRARSVLLEARELASVKDPGLV